MAHRLDGSSPDLAVVATAPPSTRRLRTLQRPITPVFRELPEPRPLDLARPRRARPTIGDAFRSRANNLIVLRLVLAMTVLASHCYPLTLGDGHGDMLYRATRAWWGGTVGLTSGFICVSLFFVLSGFVITHSFVRAGDLLTFARKRALRIYPAYVVSAVVCLLVIAPLAMQALPVGQWSGFAWDVICLRQYDVPGIFGMNPFPHALNGSLWSIKYEVACYGLIALLGTIGALRRPGLIASLLGIVATVYALQISGTLERVGMRLWWPRTAAWLFGEIEHWPRVLTYHLAGMTLYLYRDHLPRSGRLAVAAVVALACLALIGPTPLFTALPMLAGYVGLCVGLSTIGRTFTARFDQFDLSYGCYLYAFPIQQLLVQLVPATRGAPLVLFVLAAPIVTGCAIASNRLIERRFRFVFRPRAAVDATRRVVGASAPAVFRDAA